MKGNKQMREEGYYTVIQRDGRYYPAHITTLQTCYYYRGSSGRNEQPISYKQRAAALKFVKRMEGIENK
jgi:hypothetical protein